MKKIKYYILNLIVLLLSTTAWAQEVNPKSQAPQMADAFREEGKIYVVIAVMGMVFLSCVIYLVIIERRLKKLETQTSSEK
jgi:heme/copper-type cytochrome/quinol oxidase subunit 2